MTPSEQYQALRTDLLAQGWTRYAPAPQIDLCDEYFAKRIPNTPNPREPEKGGIGVILKAYSHHHEGKTHHGFELEIRSADAEETWADFKLYGLGFNEVTRPALDRHIHKLLVAWRAFTEVSQ